MRGVCENRRKAMFAKCSDLCAGAVLLCVAAAIARQTVAALFGEEDPAYRYM